MSSQPDPSQASEYAGTGDDVVSIIKPNPEGVLATITGNDAGESFSVEGRDGDEESLVYTHSPYTGTVLLDADGGETTQLTVSATGPWAITLNSMDAAPRFTDTYSGDGDEVVIFEGDRPGVAKITGNQQSENFSVEAYSSEGNEALVYTYDPYTGRVPFPGGVVVVAVTATGAWSITVTDT